MHHFNTLELYQNVSSMLPSYYAFDTVHTPGILHGVRK